EESTMELLGLSRGKEQRNLVGRHKVLYDIAPKSTGTASISLGSQVTVKQNSLPDSMEHRTL
ncbi:hypothetical protein P7K49_037654, partial [Saguinus oedipus]